MCPSDEQDLNMIIIFRYHVNVKIIFTFCIKIVSVHLLKLQVNRQCFVGHLSDKLKSFHLTTVIFGQVNRKIGGHRKLLFRMVKFAESSPKRSYKKVAIPYSQKCKVQSLKRAAPSFTIFSLHIPNLNIGSRLLFTTKYMELNLCQKSRHVKNGQFKSKHAILKITLV